MDNPIPYEADDYYEGDDRTPDQLEIAGLWQEIHSLRAQLENNKKAKAIRRKTIAALMAENKSLRQELDEAREMLKKVLEANSQQFKLCPDCERNTLWQHHEQLDDYGWEVNDYCYECGYDPRTSGE